MTAELDVGSAPGPLRRSLMPGRNLAAMTAAHLATKHPDYAVLAAHIAISTLYKGNFSAATKDLHKYGAWIYLALPCVPLNLNWYNSQSQDLQGHQGQC